MIRLFHHALQLIAHDQAISPCFTIDEHGEIPLAIEKHIVNEDFYFSNLQTNTCRNGD